MEQRTSVGFRLLTSLQFFFTPWFIHKIKIAVLPACRRVEAMTAPGPVFPIPYPHEFLRVLMPL
jgi:hypothetical protein